MTKRDPKAGRPVSVATSQINWYPGHMAKARRQMEEWITKVDMIIEVRDARIPLSSANPLLTQLAAQKPRLIILAKSDKADPDITAQWVKYLTSDNNLAVAADLLHDPLPSLITKASRQLNAARIERLQAKGVKNVLIKALVCGIPNVGKSTLINQTAHRRIAKTSDRPGVTQALQWLKVGPSLVLLDTPGVLWPKFDDQQVGYKLALTGAISDDVLPLEEVAHYALEQIKNLYPQRLVERYALKPEDMDDLWTSIGYKRGCISAAQSLDEKRLAILILREARDGQWGRISWENCHEFTK
jgi:ribosome biogenesis GTPase A